MPPDGSTGPVVDRRESIATRPHRHPVLPPKPHRAARIRIGQIEKIEPVVLLRVEEPGIRIERRRLPIRNAALDVAERTFEVEQSRFELGLADSQELLDAQTNLTQSRTDALNAVVSYQRSMQSLRQATMATPRELVVDAG